MKPRGRGYGGQGQGVIAAPKSHTYVLKIEKEIKLGIGDDPLAREQARNFLAQLSLGDLMGCKISLQEIYTNKAPRKLPL